MNMAMNRLFILSLVALAALVVYVFDFKGWVGGLTGGPPKECQFTRASEGARINTDDPKYPLEFVEDCYKFIRYFEKPVINKKSGELLYKEEKAEWRWRYTVKNKSDNMLIVYVTYKLKDKDGIVLGEKVEVGYVRPKDTAIMYGQIIMDKDMADKVSDSGWSISYVEAKK